MRLRNILFLVNGIALIAFLVMAIVGSRRHKPPPPANLTPYYSDEIMAAVGRLKTEVERGHPAGAEVARLAHGLRHCVRDVVVLEVEENPLPASREGAHEVGPGGGEEPAADLEHPDLAGQALDQAPRQRRRRQVQGDDQALARSHPQSSSAGRPGYSSVPTRALMSANPWRAR